MIMTSWNFWHCAKTILPHDVFHAGEQPWLPLLNQFLALSELQLMSVGIVLVVKVESWLTLLFWLVLFLRGMRMAMIKMRANASEIIWVFCITSLLSKITKFVELVAWCLSGCAPKSSAVQRFPSNIPSSEHADMLLRFQHWEETENMPTCFWRFNFWKGNLMSAWVPFQAEL